MSLFKQVRDQTKKAVAGKSLPAGLFEASEYFRRYGAIQFDFKPEDDMTVAVSTNFRFGSIVTFGRTAHELDENIKDAILTSFEIPSSYADKLDLRRVEDAQQQGYALA